MHGGQQSERGWAPGDQSTGPAFGAGAQGTARVRGSASPTGSLFDPAGQGQAPARGAASPGFDDAPPARGAASPAASSSFEGDPPARGTAQPTGSLFDPGTQPTGQVRGSARPAGATYGPAPTYGPESTGPIRDSGPQPTGTFRDAGPAPTGTFRDGGSASTGAFRDSGPEPTGAFRDAGPAPAGTFRDGAPQDRSGPPTGTFRDGAPPATEAFRAVGAASAGAFGDGEARPTGTFRDGENRPTGTFRDGEVRPTGTFRDGEARPTGTFRDGEVRPAGASRDVGAVPTGAFRDEGAFRDAGPAPAGALRDDEARPTGTFRDGERGQVTGPHYGDGAAYGGGQPAGAAYGGGQTGPVYGGGQPGGPVYGATRAPDPGATRGPEDLFAAQAYQPEERAGRRKLPLPGETPPARSGSGRRTAIILGAIAALVIGAGTAGAATFLSGDDPAPATSQPPVARQGSEGTQPGASQAPVAPGPADGVSLSATGDIVMGMAPGGLPPNGGKGFFDPVKEFLAADFQMGNLEQVLTEDTGVGKCSAESAGKTCFAFRTPPSYVENLKDAGFMMMTMANNHAYDFGEVGYKNSQKALDGAGIKYTGWPGTVSVGEAKGVKIAVVGFASYKWSNLCSDLDAAEKVIKEAATQADLVVVQVHQGAEGSDKTHTKPGTEFFLGENRCDTVAFAHKVIDAGADLVVGHGPHVMRAMEFYKGRLIAYSLGNFAGYKALSYNGTVGIGGVLKVTLSGDGTFKSGSLTATYMVAPGLPKPDPKKQAIPFVSNLTKQDFPTTGPKISTEGVITPPAGG